MAKERDGSVVGTMLGGFAGLDQRRGIMIAVFQMDGMLA